MIFFASWLFIICDSVYLNCMEISFLHKYETTIISNGMEKKTLIAASQTMENESVVRKKKHETE